MAVPALTLHVDAGWESPWAFHALVALEEKALPYQLVVETLPLNLAGWRATVVSFFARTDYHNDYVRQQDVDIAAGNGRPGDKIILSGTMADHGATIICQQEGLQIHGEFKSDSAPLHRMVAAMLAAAGRGVHVLRDPTRGGVGTTLNELAAASGVGIRIVEADLPVREDVRGACELLGLDPLYLANEGKLLALVAPEQADIVLAAIRQDPLGSRACIIGEAVADHPGQVVLETAVGGRRLVDMLHGEALPRIC